MLDIRPVLLILGILISILAGAMAIPAVVEVFHGDSDWQVYAVSAAISLFSGGALVLSSRTGQVRFSLRQAFLLTVLVWVVLPFFACIPMMFSELRLSLVDAYFEAVSGITTTGSTVIVGLDNAPPGILLWRGILQWLGGIGIIIMALTVLPLLRVGGMQIFRVEAFETEEKVLPRATELASAVFMVYIALTVLWAVMYWFAGMGRLDAAVHAMTTIATGGFSTADASLGKFSTPVIDAIAVTGMVVGGIPFILYLQALRGQPVALWRDAQVQGFLGTLAVGIAAVAGYLWWIGLYEPLTALRHAATNVTSIMTGTGYATVDFWQWGGLAVGVLFGLMFVGGCAGSTTCGIKVFRFQVLYAAARVQLARALQPHGIFIATYNRRPIDDGVAESVTSFFFLFALSVALLAMALAALGLDFVTALTGAATAIANVGPGFGATIGPAGTFAPLPDEAKWLLSAGMIFGRLELFTVLVLLLPRFWRR